MGTESPRLTTEMNNVDEYEPMETGRALMTDINADLENPDSPRGPKTPPARRAVRKRRPEMRQNVIQPLNLNITIPPLSQLQGSEDIY